MSRDCARAALARRLLEPGTVARMTKWSLDDDEAFGLALDVEVAGYDTGQLYLQAMFRRDARSEPVLAALEGQLRRDANSIGWRHYQEVSQ